MRKHRHLRFVIGCCLCGYSLSGLSQQPAQTPAAAGPGAIEEIVVTGSYIRRASQFDSPSPLTTIGFEDIADLGVNEISDIIERMTINTGSQNNPDAFTQNASTGTTNINLRGLGVNSTLVMLNSRRQVHSAVTTNRGNNFVDTSALPPMIAIDRIETLKDGATALYGSDAVAGVVNFITRSDFEGLDVQFDVQTVAGHPQDDQQFSLLYGGGTDRTHVLLAFSVLDRKPLTTTDKRLSTIADDLSAVGNPGSFLVTALPGNPAYAPVWTAAFDTNFNGVADLVEPTLGLPPVPGALTPLFVDPDCNAIAAQDPKVVPGVAQSVPSPSGDIGIGLCQFDFGSYFSLVPEEERVSAYVELNHVFGDGLDGRLELHLTDNEALRNNSPSFPITERNPISVNHPDNPFGTDVLWIGRVVGGGGTAGPTVHDSMTWRVAGSLTGDFNDNWGWDVGFQRSRNEFFVGAEDTVKDRLYSALTGFGGPDCDPAAGAPGIGDCRWFNPFGSSLTGTGTVNTPELIDHIQGPYTIDANTRLTTFDGVVTGNFGALPGGPAGIAVGAQIREEETHSDYSELANRDAFMFVVGNPDFASSREVTAAFVELLLPVSEQLDLQLAARIEDYGGGVDSTDPKLTALWRPTDSFALRASVGTSFRSPSIFQAFGTQTTLEELTDPLVPGATQFLPVRTQPNLSGKTLRPETADVANLGFTFSPGGNLELGVDYWSFDYTDVIIQQNPQALLDAAVAGDAAAARQIERGPTGGLLRVNSFYDNASSLRTDGLDFSIAYTMELAAGTLRLGAQATAVSTYDLADPQAGVIDGAGKRNFANFATS
ncbi:MAG: TonB-dependent receptor, partial [Proteobacteria bacterium]|nr:TonB-dependent receptor [Pseudomonadota bacterium]